MSNAGHHIADQRALNASRIQLMSSELIQLSVASVRVCIMAHAVSVFLKHNNFAASNIWCQIGRRTKSEYFEMQWCLALRVMDGCRV